MLIPHLYVPLCCVSSMYFRWDQLERSLFFCHKCLCVLEHSLSKMYIFGFRPLSLSFFCITIYALVISVPSFDFVESTMMAFESCSYANIMYLYSLEDVTGNCPAWSVYSLDENSITEKNTQYYHVRVISSSDITFVGTSIRCSIISLFGMRSLLDFLSLLGVILGFYLWF